MVDAEIIGTAKRLIAGVEGRDDPLALTLMRKMGHEAEYLAEPHTLKWFQKEFYIPSEVIDRGSYDEWEGAGGKTALQRSKDRVDELVRRYSYDPIDEHLQEGLRAMATAAGKPFGVEALPSLPEA